MIVFPNAKINIGLNIVERLNNGYHVIESVFVPVALCDALEVLPQKELNKPTANFTSFGIEIPGNAQHNICLKAIELLSQKYEFPAVAVQLLKKIPIGAGLGGGSADGAFTLKAINNLFDLGISTHELEHYAALLGSDCPFFIPNTTAYQYGVGGNLSPIDLPLTGLHYLLVYPNLHISTAQAYANCRPMQPAIDLKTALQAPMHTWKDSVFNDFEKTVNTQFPALPNIKKELYSMGAIYAAMSGSGSTVFGIFDHKPQISAAFAKYNCFLGQW